LREILIFSWIGAFFCIKIKYPVGWAVGKGLNTVDAEGLTVNAKSGGIGEITGSHSSISKSGA
jgi:hypothetical protein